MADAFGNGAIACIGWGSLIWDPRDLPCRGTWHNDGPLLPVEFARESGGTKDKPGDKITLVICPDSPRVRTYWTLLDVPDIRTACERLANREYERATAKWAETNIGFWDRASGAKKGLEADTVAAWADGLMLGGVVWTSLPCGFKKSRGVMPSSAEIIAFLENLGPDDKPGAEGYVRQAPPQIDTPYRRRIERELRWSRRP